MSLILTGVKPTIGHEESMDRFTVWIFDDTTETEARKVYSKVYDGRTRFKLLPFIKDKKIRDKVRAIVDSRRGFFRDTNPHNKFVPEEPKISDHKIGEMVIFPDGSAKVLVKVNGSKQFCGLDVLRAEAEALIEDDSMSVSKGNPFIREDMSRQSIKDDYETLSLKKEKMLGNRHH